MRSEDSQFKEKIIQDWPYPIAQLYKEMLDEKDERLRFRNLIKVFVGLLKYISIICIADYKIEPDCEQINSKLYESLDRPSLGKWMEFCRMIIKHYRDKERSFHVNELLDVLNKKTNKTIDFLIHLRNIYVHPDLFLHEDESRRIYQENLDKLYYLIDRFSFLCKYPLVRISIKNSSEIKFQGVNIQKNLVGEFKFFIRNANDKHLEVTPFLTLVVDEELNDLLIYETLLGSTATYVRGNIYKIFSTKEDPLHHVELLNSFISAFKTTEEDEKSINLEKISNDRDRLSDLDIKKLFYISQDYSNRVFEEYRKNGRFHNPTYVRRHDIEKSFSKLLNGDKNCLVIVADSGNGKSTQLCYWFVEKFKNDIVWFLSGRNIRTEEIFLSIERYFSLDKLYLFNRVRKNERFIVLFDGLNEVDDPVGAIIKINEFLEKNTYPWLKVIITCRGFTWSEIEKKGLLFKEGLYVLSDNNKISNHLLPLNDDELKECIEKYSFHYHKSMSIDSIHDHGTRKILRNPLIMRFLFEAYKDMESEIPAQLDMDSIMKEFTNERIRKQDLPFLEKYLMYFFYQNGKDILISGELLIYNETVRRQIFINDYNIAELSEIDIYEKLKEHIFSEQTYEVDQVWTCSEKECKNSREPQPVLEEEENPRCSICRAKLEFKNLDNRSTYYRLLSENILSENKDGDDIYIRFVFDKYFDFLMSNFIFKHLMNEEYNRVSLLAFFDKAQKNNIFFEPFKNLLLTFLKQDKEEPFYEIAKIQSFESYHVLRDIQEELAREDFSKYLKFLTKSARLTNFDENLCRSAAYALLVDSSFVKNHKEDIIEAILFLSSCSAETFHEDVAQYLIELKKDKEEEEGIDLFSPLITQIGKQIIREVSVFRGIIILVNRSRWRAFKGRLILLTNLILFGFGNFYHDTNIQSAFLKYILGIIQKMLRHPLLSLFQSFLTRFLTNKVKNVYKDKGPAPCNYWEMLLQLRENSEAIKTTGEFFLVEKQNLFDFEFEEFRNTVHSENGLITWYFLSLLPVHYAHYSDHLKAIKHLRFFFFEGTVMDRYVAANAVAQILRNESDPSEELESLFYDMGKFYIEQHPEEIFVHPRAMENISEANQIAKYNNDLVENNKIREGGNLYLIPWIRFEQNLLYRMYLNGFLGHYELLRIDKENLNYLEDVLIILEKNQFGNILNFGDDLNAQRRFVISFVIGSLFVLSLTGDKSKKYIRITLNTIEEIVDHYIKERSDPENFEVYRFAICEVLKKIKEYFRDEVYTFLEKFDLTNPTYQFLLEVKMSATENEKLYLNKSFYGNKIYQSSFIGSKEIREVFGLSTQKASRAKNVEDFFYIYGKTFMKWLKTVEV